MCVLVRCALLVAMLLVTGCGGRDRAVPVEPEYDWPDAAPLVVDGGS
jgi:hypothetical protein